MWLVLKQHLSILWEFSLQESTRLEFSLQEKTRPEFSSQERTSLVLSCTENSRMMLRCCRRPGLLRLIFQTRRDVVKFRSFSNRTCHKNGSWWHQGGGTCSLKSVRANDSPMAVVAAHQLSSHLLGFFMYVTLCYPSAAEKSQKAAL